jgi:sugar/nucleoside kinase (ribokinase family)
MINLEPLDPIDYLMIGHITHDLTPTGVVLGGTAAYSALTARALGLRVGIVSAFGENVEFPELEGIPIVALRDTHTTTFENIPTPQRRIQIIHQVAPNLDISLVPEEWRSTPIVHLGPVAREIDPNLIRSFPNSLICLTPQGWMREWDASGKVHFSEWPEASYVLSNSTITIISVADVPNESYIEEFTQHAHVLAVTEGPQGVRIYWNGDLRRFNSPQRDEVDATGAGDIFATTFFARYYQTRDPWEAARYATYLASSSVTRKGLQGIPTQGEIQAGLIHIVDNR